MPVAAACALACLSGSLAFSQHVIHFANGMTGVAKLDMPPARGPAQNKVKALAAIRGAAPASGLTFFTANFRSFDAVIPLTFIGTNPMLGSATSTTPTVIIPIKFVFSNGAIFDAGPFAAPTAASPLFETTHFTTGGTSIGFTQYGDAIQRAEFWNLTNPAGSAPDYHVLLGKPAIEPTQTVNVPRGLWTEAHIIGSSFVFGIVDVNFFANVVIPELLTQFDIQPGTLPIFIDADTYLSVGGGIPGCCIGGFHSSTQGPIQTAQTWVFAVYISPQDGVFGPGTGDVSALSHEVSEWMNDPFVGAFPSAGFNFVAPYQLPGQGTCMFNLEDGDPLEAPTVTTFTEVTNGKTYHLQDEAFVPWFTHAVPSFSVNGFYSYLGTFRMPSALCGPG